jgi:hypothetical protein
MDIGSVKNNIEGFLDYMKETGYPVFHDSNIFLRDFEYAVRDYFRTTTNKDIGSRKAGTYAIEIVAVLEEKDLMIRRSGNTWTLKMEKFLLQPEPEEEPAEKETKSE